MKTIVCWRCSRLQSCKSSLIAAIVQVGGWVMCIYMCLVAPQQFHPTLDVMDQPHAATHLRAAGVKTSQHMYQGATESSVILQGWCKTTRE